MWNVETEIARLKGLGGLISLTDVPFRTMFGVQAHLVTGVTPHRGNEAVKYLRRAWQVDLTVSRWEGSACVLDPKHERREHERRLAELRKQFDGDQQPILLDGEFTEFAGYARPPQLFQCLGSLIIAEREVRRIFGGQRARVLPLVSVARGTHLWTTYAAQTSILEDFMPEHFVL